MTIGHIVSSNIGRDAEVRSFGIRPSSDYVTRLPPVLRGEIGPMAAICPVVVCRADSLPRFKSAPAAAIRNVSSVKFAGWPWSAVLCIVDKLPSSGSGNRQPVHHFAHPAAQLVRAAASPVSARLTMIVVAVGTSIPDCE